jgi:arylsulfatase A-like enzyme
MTAASLALLAHAAPERPNIVVVLADDMGWGDSGTYGHGLIQTPNMDRLAARGMKFTQAYSAAGVCSPSRSAVLTGRTPYRNGVWQHLSGVHPTHLRSSEVTYPELLREIGYETCHVGKWHLLPRQQYANPEFPQVGVQGGYDYWFATQNNADPSHQNPDNFYRNGAALGLLEGYSAPLVADEAIHWLKDLRNPEKPFVLSVWFHEPHKPIATDVKFADLYGDHKNKVYMGNISQMDYALGQLLNTLDEIGATENTLIFFSSDNGPVRSEGGSTGGLRGGKRSSYEGGIRVPGIMSWPGHITPGAETNTPIIGTDIFTTVLDIVGLLVPSDRTIDGVSLLPVFEGKSVTRTTPLYWRTHVSSPTERSAIRIGEWKLISNDLMTEFELYNIAADPEEAKDLAAQMPEKTEKLKRELFKVWNSIEDEGPREWWRECQTKPIRNGNLAY